MHGNITAEGKNNPNELMIAAKFYFGEILANINMLVLT